MTRDLVVCSLESWDEVWRRNQFLVAGLLDADPELRVLFVEPSSDPTHALSRGRRPSRARGLRRVPDVGGGRLWAYQQVKVGPRQLGPAVDAALDRGVLRAIRRIGLSEPILWINDPSRVTLVRRTGWTSLYDITDDWLVAVRSGRQQQRVAANEAELMERCAAVVVCSPHLQRTKGVIRPVDLVPNAVDLARYLEPTERPRDLPCGPTVVYVGTLHEDRLDTETCVDLARSLAGAATLVFVGPNSLAGTNTARLLSEPNVRLLGARPHTAVPAYLQHADVLVTPHVVTDFTESLDPIKVYEYLAAARPIVSTPVAGFRDAAGPVTVVPAATFATAVRTALDSDQTLSAPVGLPTWADRAAGFRAVLDRIV